MPDWLIEEGVGEERAICLRGGEIVAARIRWPGELAAGQVVEGKLASRRAGSPRGIAQLSSGVEVLLDRLPTGVTEGSSVSLAITRAPMAERGRLKLAQGRLTDETPRPAPSLAESLRNEGHGVETVRQFPARGWDELVAEAFEREVPFAGGSLLLAPTPAMVLIDVDGTLPPRELALAAVPAIAATLSRLDIGGAVGIDFPTLSDKADRKAVDQALDAALAQWPHERTAMNGFGFVQLVARLERPSLLHLAAHRRTGMAARQLLRRAEAIEEPGALLLACHPAIKAKLRDDWLEQLARRTGREVRLAGDPALALEAGFAQAVPR